MASNTGHMNRSSAFSTMNSFTSVFKMDDVVIHNTDGFIYLGLPIGNTEFTENFFCCKMSKVETTMYSLRSLGCKSNNMNPKTIFFIYKRYCQSIITFGLENIYLSSTFLSHLNVRQNVLLKCICQVVVD